MIKELTGDASCFFYESPNSEVSQLGFEKINRVDFFRLENSPSSFANKKFDVSFWHVGENFDFL